MNIEVNHELFGALALRGGHLYAFQHPYDVDGRVSWHPPSVRGVAPMNCYLLVEGDEALLIDTGLVVHRQALVDQLAALVSPGASLRILHTRLGEFNSMSNTAAVIEALPVACIYDRSRDVADWLLPTGESRPETETRIIDTTITLGGDRVVEVFSAVLKLLPTTWAYDRLTRTLFTSDMFSHVLRGNRDESGAWMITDRDPRTLRADLRRHLLETRYWWLAGAETDPLRRGLADQFEEYDIETIAPAYGCIIHGREAVRHEWELLDQLLMDLESGDGAR